MTGVTTISCDDKSNEQAARCGIKPGQAFDSTRQDEKGHCLRTEKPDLLVDSPICGPLSQMQNINDKNSEAFHAKLKMAIAHLTFTLECFDLQVLDDKKFVSFGHPWTCKSWEMDLANEAMTRFGLDICFRDQCFSATTEHTDRHGTTGLIKKPTGFMTNCPEMVRITLPLGAT